MKRAWSVAVVLVVSALGCGGEAPTVHDGGDLARRAYVVSREHPELTVFDLGAGGAPAIIGRVDTGGVANHMAELSADLRKIYVTSSDGNELVVVDAATLAVRKRVPVGGHPTHLTLVPGGRRLAIMVEDDNAVAFIDTTRDEVEAVVPGFATPHFMRFSADGKTGYVANIGANHLTRVDLATLTVRDHLPLAGFAGPPNATPARDEGGFADAQIDREGRLYAAHHATGRVLVYDTVGERMLPELTVSAGAWVVFAEHPFANVPLRHLVPSFADKSLALIDAGASNIAALLPGDQEAYGVNFTSVVPNRAFVMNRMRQDVAVVDTAKGAITARIAVGGNTETASTTADGKFVVAAVSGADRVVFIDAATGAIAKSFDGVGRYPWSVTIPGGQNYCH